MRSLVCRFPVVSWLRASGGFLGDLRGLRLSPWVAPPFPFSLFYFLFIPYLSPRHAWGGPLGGFPSLGGCWVLGLDGWLFWLGRCGVVVAEAALVVAPAFQASTGVPSDGLGWGTLLAAAFLCSW